VLIKGGHGDGAESVDLMVDARSAVRLVAPRVATKNTHGTGCTLSSAIAAGLARGTPLTESIALAKKFVSEAIAAADGLNVGEGRGPVHHFYEFWKKD